VAQHEKGESLREEVADASTELQDLKAKIAFNREFTEALEEVRDLNTRIDTAKDDLEGGEVAPVIDNLEGIEAAIRGSKLPVNNVAGILSTKASELRRSISDHVHGYWNSLVRVDTKAHELAIVSNSPGKFSETSVYVPDTDTESKIHYPELRRPF
jgi:hypothetical protein